MEKQETKILQKANLFFKKAKYKKAIVLYQKLNLYPAVQINLAQAFLLLKDYKTAISYALNIKHKKACQILAQSYFELSDYGNAVVYYEKLWSAGVQDEWIANYLSQSYERLEQIDKAIKYGFYSLELAPDDDNQHLNFGYLIYETNNQEAAKLWLEKYPHNSIAQHMGKAVIGNQEIDKINPKYLKQVFDAFSCDFDDVLKKLDYAAPKYIEEICNSIPLKKAHILDAGCGSGLCGNFLKKMAKKNGLEGVDISSQMIEVANKKNLYHHLIEDDLQDFLDSKTQVYDAIIASDVLTYFADLKKVFSVCQKALKNKAHFIFTVSQNNIDESNCFLHPSGRFIHSEKYVINALQDSGFLLQKKELKKLRNEGQKEVFGWVIWAIKKAS